MSDLDSFKTTLVGGFDKDDVLSSVRDMRQKADEEQERLLKKLDEQEKIIAKLRTQLDSSNEKIRSMESDINVKYKKYVENYDNIGKLVFDAQVKADEMIKDAERQREEIIEKTRKQCEEKIVEVEALSERMMFSVEKEVNEKLADGKRKYLAVQEEMNEIVHLINQAQNRFMTSYREIHRIVSEMPESYVEVDEEELQDIASMKAMFSKNEMPDQVHEDDVLDEKLRGVLDKIPDRSVVRSRLEALTGENPDDALQVAVESDFSKVSMSAR